MGSPITLSGFNNIDFAQVLNALMAQERLPVVQLEEQKKALTNQKGFFATFASKLAALESAVEALTAANAFEGRAAALSDTTAAAVSAGADTPVGAYSVLVTSLARAQVTGTSSTHTDRDSTIVASGGTLTIGGVTVSISGDVTLQGLADAINGTADVPVTASIVQNGANYQLVLTGRETGADHAFTLTNNLTGGSGVAFSATNAQEASNASGTVNGIPFSGPTNTIEGVIPGSSLTLYKEEPTNPVVITITADRSSVKELIRKVQAAYNEVVSFIDDQQRASAERNPSSIGGDPLVRSLRSQLAQVLVGERAVGGPFTAISQVGLGFSRTGQLEFNEAAFDAALDQDPEAVQRLFRGDGVNDGAFTAFLTTIESYTAAGGLIPTAQRRLDDQVLKIGDRIDDFELRLEARRVALQKEFTAADLAMKQLNSSLGQLGSLAGSFGSF